MMGAGYSAVPLEQMFYDKLIGEQLKFAWLPVKCSISGKSIWLTYGYKLTALYTGPSQPLFEHKWHDKNEHIIWKLKR
jgi:hypothetical protein